LLGLEKSCSSIMSEGGVNTNSKKYPRKKNLCEKLNVLLRKYKKNNDFEGR